MGGLRVNYNSESDKAGKAKLDERPELRPLGMDQQSPTLSGDSCCKEPKDPGECPIGCVWPSGRPLTRIG